ncbi:MAG: GTPase ObgE [Planctomycetota bacterium]|nr:GTPase ObgE [Planctomycetota bacterium]MDA1163284.1 GTPase ObgE [Planctomycetota bacterium]
MFIDQIELHCKGGDGGNGCLSFRREAHVPRGGPDGGDGAYGGNVIVQAVKDLTNLAHLLGHKHWNAERGNHGQGQLRTGKRGKDSIIQVPVGTLIYDGKRGNLLRDLDRDGESVTVAKGGHGGRGNKHFATSVNRAPREFEKGQPGEQRSIRLDLKLIADVGLVGKPNAGKSTLLSRMTRATPEIANYPFTTKYPNLGMVRVGYGQQFVMADIPGLIEGAHDGVGLGHEFLRHVERTRVFVHLIEPTPMDGSNPIENYRNIREELRLYDASLLNRPEIPVVTKCELPDADSIVEQLSQELGRPVMRISAVTGKGLPELTRELLKLVDPQDAEEDDWQPPPKREYV